MLFWTGIIGKTGSGPEPYVGLRRKATLAIFVMTQPWSYDSGCGDSGGDGCGGEVVVLLVVWW